MPVTINIAYTAPINPAGAEPKLNQTQIWTGLERKVRHAQEFVAIIVGCDVVSEEQSAKGYLTVTRDVTFKGAPGPVREVCTHYAPARVDFEQDNGSFISNIVSKGPDGELLMTYSFAWAHPDVAEGSADVQKLEADHWKTAKIAVEGSINTIRRLVKEGTMQ